MSRIACIIPTYNSAPYLRTALESVISQTRVPDEIIVINDGSTDNSLQILEEFKSSITLINTANRGVSAALNTGIRCSSADYLSFLDADDIWVPGKTERQYEELDASIDTSAVFGMVQQFVSEDAGQSQFVCNEEAMPGISKLTMMIRRADFLKVGYFDETIVRGDFVQWFSRFINMGLVYKTLPDVLAHRRLRPNSLSSKKEFEVDLVKIMRQHLIEKRKSRGKS